MTTRAAWIALAAFFCLPFLLLELVSPPPSGSGSAAGIVTWVGIAGGFYLLARGSRLLMRFRKVATIGGVAVSSPRIAGLLSRHKEVLSAFKGRVTERRVRRALLDAKVMRDVGAFHTHHMDELDCELGDGRTDWGSENCKLFFEMLKEKYGLEQPTVLACLLYVAQERDYEDYRDSLVNSKGLGPKAFMCEVVLSDIYCERQLDQLFVARVTGEFGIKIAPTSIARVYAKAQKRIKLAKFEKNLHSGAGVSTPIEEQIRTEARARSISEKFKHLLDVEPESYVIVGEDHSRTSRIDAYYRRHFSYVLSRAFDGHCCSCNEGMGQLEFDHFWFPKSSGGNFLMRARDGVYVNNCIPLCRSCNASKGARDFRTFFSDEALLIEIVQRSQSVGAYVNQHMVTFEDPHFEGRVF